MIEHLVLVLYSIALTIFSESLWLKAIFIFTGTSWALIGLREAGLI